MPETIYTKIRGVSHYQKPIRDFLDEYTDIYLEHEIENEYSEHAIIVYADGEEIQQNKIGYLSDDLAKRYIDQIQNIECFVEEITGKDILGVNIRLVVYTDEEMQERAVQKRKVSPIPETNLPDGPIGDRRPKPTFKTPPPTPIRTNISPKSRTTALILCLLLGYFGGHQFYAGRKGMGIIYIFTVGIFLFGWVTDFMIILFGQFKDKEGRLISNW
jgi:hypothetical protein